MSNDIWLLPEKDTNRLGHFSLGLIGEGQRVSNLLGGGVLCAILPGRATPAIVDQCAGLGITRLYQTPEGLGDYPGQLAVAIAATLSNAGARLLLAVSSAFGSDLMPRIAAKLAAPLVTNCLDISGGGDRLEFSKPVNEGKRRATLRALADGLQLATILPEGLSPPTTVKSGRNPELLELSNVGQSPGPRIRQVLKADCRTVDIREAEFVVAIGRGIDTPERRLAVEQFAELIGASIGGSRMAVDAGLVSYDRQIGQTGKRISPRLVVLCGISGSEYFMQGIAPNAVKIAINPDRKAPVFASADLGIVADAHDIIARFNASMRARAHAE